MQRVVLVLAIALFLSPSTAGSAGTTARSSRLRAGAPHPQCQLTVVGIMRRPDLVGHPSTNLRWSADSQKLYFQRRKLEEKESSTDDEVKTIPPANGRRDEAHRRMIFVDGGDTVLVDSATGTRRQIIRTTT